MLELLMASLALNAGGAFFVIRLIKKGTRLKDANKEYEKQFKLLADRISDLGGGLPDGMFIDAEGNIRRD